MWWVGLENQHFSARKEIQERKGAGLPQVSVLPRCSVSFSLFSPDIPLLVAANLLQWVNYEKPKSLLSSSFHIQIKHLCLWLYNIVSFYYMWLVTAICHLGLMLIHGQAPECICWWNAPNVSSEQAPCWAGRVFIGWAVTSIPSTSCKSGLTRKRNGEPWSQTSRAGNGKAAAWDLAGWVLPNSRGSHSHVRRKWHSLGLFKLQSFFPRVLAFLGYLLSHIVPHFYFCPTVFIVFEASCGFCRFALGCLQGIVLYLSG